MRAEDGKIIKWYGVVTDIEDRKRVEEALRRNEHCLAEAQRLSHVGSVGMEVSTKRIFWSDESARIYGYAPGTVPTPDLILQREKRVTLAGFGIVPRTVPGLAGIAFSPLLHASPAHLLANALPLFVLLVLLFCDRHYYPVLTLSSIWFFSGLGTWLIGRGNTVHIGASSIIFGLVAYLIVAGFLMRSWRSAIVAIVVALAFGGIFYGVLPQTGPISWEGHLADGRKESC